MSDTPDRWTDEQNEVYSRVLRFMATNPQAFVHPNAPLIDAEFWDVTCHNAAWFAAECAGECGKITFVDSDTNEVFASESGATLQ